MFLGRSQKFIHPIPNGLNFLDSSAGGQVSRDFRRSLAAGFHRVGSRTAGLQLSCHKLNVGHATKCSGNLIRGFLLVESFLLLNRTSKTLKW